MSAIRIVAPFRPLPLEAGVHLYLKHFDWIAAVRQLVESAEKACRCPVHVVTDVDTDLPVPSLQYATRHRRLMLWVLEACLRYLESDDFDRDTVMLDIDQLIYHDLAPFFPPAGIDVGILVRPQSKHRVDRGQPFLNGVQFWSYAGKARLVAFYQRALQIAEQMPEHQIVWGADTDAVRELLEPLTIGLHERAGLRVAMLDSDRVLESFTRMYYKQFQRDGVFPVPMVPVLDFRGRRKEYMPLVYRVTYGAGA